MGTGASKGEKAREDNYRDDVLEAAAYATGGGIFFLTNLKVFNCFVPKWINFDSNSCWNQNLQY